MNYTLIEIRPSGFLNHKAKLKAVVTTLCQCEMTESFFKELFVPESAFTVTSVDAELFSTSEALNRTLVLSQAARLSTSAAIKMMRFIKIIKI